MLGIAREAAALMGKSIREPVLEYAEGGEAAESRSSVQVLDPDLCPRYIAGVVMGVTIEASPAWMQRRLEAAGMRPINNIVDVTNYVMLEFGQPLHAFDYDLLGGNRIVVRRAREGERLTSIDGQSRALEPEMLAIADASVPVAVAGVMGGVDSEVRGEHHHYSAGIGLLQQRVHPKDVESAGDADGGLASVREGADRRPADVTRR